MKAIKYLLPILLMIPLIWKSAGAQSVLLPNDFYVYVENNIAAAQNEATHQWVLDSAANLPSNVNQPSSQTFTQVQQDSVNVAMQANSSQTNTEPNVQVTLSQQERDSLMMIGRSEIVKYVSVITLSDTIDISKLHLKLGIVNETIEIYNGEFLYTGSQNLPAMVTYTRHNNQVQIEIEQRGYHAFTKYAEIRIADNLGNLSSPLVYEFN